MELITAETKGTPNTHPSISSVLLKDSQEEKVDPGARAFDFYLDFMDPELESQW